MKEEQRQLTSELDISPPLNKKETKRIQSIVGTLLYYALGTDNTILPVLNDIALFQIAPTEKSVTNAKDSLTILLHIHMYLYVITAVTCNCMLIQMLRI